MQCTVVNGEAECVGGDSDTDTDTDTDSDSDTDTDSDVDCVQVGGSIECDPQDQIPCDTASGYACDTAYKDDVLNGFQCWEPPNDVTLDQACGETEGYCQPGLHCFAETSTCKQYCCTNTDCTSGGVCTYDLSGGDPIFSIEPDLGVCI